MPLSCLFANDKMHCWFASLEVSNSAVIGTLGQPSCASMWPPGYSSMSALCRLHHKQGTQNHVCGGAIGCSFIIKKISGARWQNPALRDSCPGISITLPAAFFLGCKPLGLRVCGGQIIGRKDKDEGDGECGGGEEGNTTIASPI